MEIVRSPLVLTSISSKRACTLHITGNEKRPPGFRLPCLGSFLTRNRMGSEALVSYVYCCLMQLQADPGD